MDCGTRRSTSTRDRAARLGEPVAAVFPEATLGRAGTTNSPGPDLRLEALVACSGVTLKAVATALDIPVKRGAVSAEGDLDFRGTLGVAKDVPVGFARIRLSFDVETDAAPERLEQLLK